MPNAKWIGAMSSTKDITDFSVMPLVRVAAAARAVAVTGDGGFLMKSQELADKA